MGLTYKDAGVDIDAGNELVRRIAPLARSTMRPEVIGGIGGFAALCEIPTGYRQPILVSGTDGVGTKLKTSIETKRHETVGIDLVAMCVNDVLVTGAEPLFFLDYFASGKLDVATGEALVKGIALGCRDAGCALVGGETAELPGLYAGHDYDLAGFCVGVVERSEIRPRTSLTAGDIVIGLPSRGLHSNGHSLARNVLLQACGHTYDDRPAELEGESIADVLLAPTIIYSRGFQRLRTAGGPWKAAAHITGGGLVENAPRVFSDNALAFAFDRRAWPIPPVFRYISEHVDEAEMMRTFNMGLGMIVIAAASEKGVCLAALSDFAPRVVGQLVPRGDGAAVRFTT